MQIEVSAEVAAAIISAVVSILTAVISFFVNRSKTKSEIAKMKLEFEHSDRVRKEEMNAETRQEQEKRYAQMLSAVDWFCQASDMNTKQAALAAINTFWTGANGATRDSVQALKEVINQADAFKGPDQGELQAALDKTRIQFFQQRNGDGNTTKER